MTQAQRIMRQGSIRRSVVTASLFAIAVGCRAFSVPTPSASPPPLDGARQLVVVTTAEWDSTTGVLRRFERGTSSEAWRAVGASTPIVVGRTGLAWGVGFDNLDATQGRAPH